MATKPKKPAKKATRLVRAVSKTPSRTQSVRKKQSFDSNYTPLAHTLTVIFTLLCVIFTAMVYYVYS